MAGGRHGAADDGGGTAGASMLLPMMCACLAATLTPTLLGDRPIYESLLDRTLGSAAAKRA